MKTAHVRSVGGLRFRAVSGSGHWVTMDAAEGDGGARPAELLLVALAGCTGMDVVSILRKKRQPVTAYEISVAGQQRLDHPAVFERIDVTHSFHGEVDREAVRRAIELSATRYCAVGGTLASGVTRIHHSFVIRREAGVERGDVLWTGPFAPVEPVAAAAG